MRREAFHRWLFVLLGAAIPLVSLAAAPAPVDARLQRGLAQLAAGEYHSAHQTLQELIDAAATTPAATNLTPALLTPALIGNAKALSKLGQHAAALQQYENALQIAADGADTTTLRLVAAEAAYHSQQFDKAMRWCEEVLAESSDARQQLVATRIQIAGFLAQQAIEDAWQTLRSCEAQLAPQLGDVANQIGAAALAQTQPQLAQQAYQWQLQHAGASGADAAAIRRQAELGIAWSAALGARPPAEAAGLLRDFATRYPEDADALRALRAEAACWRQAGDAARADEALLSLVELTQRRPATVAGEIAIAVVDELSARHERPQPESLRAARRQIVMQGPQQTRDQAPNLLAAAIVDAAANADEDYWKESTAQALAHSLGEEIVAGALQRLSAAAQDAYAERLAAVVLGGIETAEAAPDLAAGPCNAACRWAANSGRWTMLALSAERLDPAVTAARLAPSSTRLLAEALIQTQRSQTAKAWFEAAITAGANDFGTLVRRAELSVALDELPIAAEMLQAAAEAAAHDRPAETALIDVLSAELAIRRARFDEARALLQRVVRLDTTEPSVRCRSQWLIGETFLLQKRFAEAIDAYRLVESFETPPGNWTAAALVQAGKSFEKLGRQRDAAICYGGLLQRFADSEHALMARDRLAVIRDGTKRR